MRKNKLKSLIIQRQGFTLIELIAVIAIVGVLAAAAVPAIGNVVERSQITQVNSDIKVVSDAVAAYVQETGTVPLINTHANRLAVKLNGTGDAYTPGVSTKAFRNLSKTATADTLYVIDIAKLTNKQVNVENPKEEVTPKLNSVPTSSVIADLNDATGAIKANSIKNTSVIYAVDKELRVYAINNTELSKASYEGKTAIPDDANYDILNPSNDMGTTGDNHDIFKTNFKTIAQSGATKLIVNTVNVSDKTYNN